MIVNAWRVRATAEDFDLPPGGLPFDVGLLKANRAEWLREAGLEAGTPYLVSPMFEYDVVLNRFFQSPGIRMHAVNTQFGYARDLAAFLTFLWVSRRGKGWRDAAEEDHLAYLAWRRRDGDGPRIAGSTWNREVAGVDAFPGQFNWMLGGAAEVGESYEEAAARELAEELGVHSCPRFVLKFLCDGVISPYWLGLHEVVITVPVQPDPKEVAWFDWLTEPELEEIVHRFEFIPDAREAFDRYRSLSAPRDPSR
ncbi:NUDIX domain-containing protein [Streptomyces sp. NPDC060334]|uniref:NUDIX domain-containing protein n=1 Tax=Streptomyces sp. NPDC060334 TaxID=3347099 RepID=UPI0036585322